MLRSDETAKEVANGSLSAVRRLADPGRQVAVLSRREWKYEIS